MACNDSEGGHPQRIVVIDNMRNRSHLFWRWFSTIPDLEPRNHPYVMPSLFGPDSWLSELRVNDARANHLAETEQVIPQTTIKDSNDTLGTWIASSDEKVSLCLSIDILWSRKLNGVIDSRAKCYSSASMPCS